MGHEAGDLMLKTVATGGASAFPSKTVFWPWRRRFSILIDNLDSLDTSASGSVADALLSQPMDIGTHELQTSASIGITLIGIDACDNSVAAQR